MNAELSYLFRHALLRDAAYQLQLPSNRARLHGLAFEILDSLLDDPTRDALSIELADHALASGKRGLRARERAYLERAVAHFQRQYQSTAAISACRRLIEHPLSDATERVGWQCRAAEISLQASDFINALMFAQQAASDAAQCRNAKDESSALQLCAMVRDSMGEREAALALFHQADEAALRGGADTEHARCLAGIANLLNRAGRSAEAEQAFGRAIEAFSKVDDERGRFNLMLHNAHFLLQSGREVEALPALLEAEARLRLEGNRRALASVLLAIGVARLAEPDSTEAERILKETAALNLEMEDRRSWSVARHNLAEIWVRQGRYAEALEVCSSNLALLREMGELSEEAVTLRRVASINLQWGKLREARSACEEAIAAARRTGDMREQGSALAFLAKICHKQGHGDHALAAFEASLEVLRKSGDRIREAIVQWHRADMLHESGRSDLARKDLEEVRRILLELNDTKNLATLEEQLRTLS